MADLEIEKTEVPLFLGQIGKCLLTLEDGFKTDNKNGIGLSVEHLIPGLAGRKHRRLLRAPRHQAPLFQDRIIEIIESRENKVNLCPTCHHLIDHGAVKKMTIYRLFGLTGLVEQIAIYPRSPDQNLFAIQYHQWRELFTMLAHNFQVLGGVSDHLQSDYSQAEDLVGRYLYRWEQGSFDQNSLIRNRHDSASFNSRLLTVCR